MSNNPQNNNHNTSSPELAQTIPLLVEHLRDKFKINTIPSSRTNRLDLERHYGRCEIIQYIINHYELAERDFHVSPISMTDSNADKDTISHERDAIDAMLEDEGYMSSDDITTFN